MPLSERVSLRGVKRLALAGALLSMAACVGDATGTSGAVALDWPLSVGRQWVYATTYSSDRRGVLSVDTVVVTARRDTTLANGERWFEMSSNPLVVGGSIVEPQYLRVDASGNVWHSESLDAVVGAPPFPLPPEFNLATYPSPARITSIPSFTGQRTTSLATSVSVPAGTFTCVEFVVGFDAQARVDCVAPGIGLVHARIGMGSGTVNGVTEQYTSTARLLRITPRPQR